MADPVADNADFAVDELKRKARRRLVGAIVIALAAATILPLVLEQEQKPLGDDVSVQIPAIDGGKFISRLKDDKVKNAPPGAKPDGAPNTATADNGAAAPALAPAGSTATPGVPAPAAVSPSSPVVDAGSRPAPDSRVGAGVAVPDAKAAGPDGKTETKGAAKAPPKADAKTRPSADVAAPAREVKPEPKVAIAAPTATTSPVPSAPSAPPSNPALSADVAKATSAPATLAAPEAMPAPSAGSPGAEPSRPEGYVVQLGAFTDNYGANALANKLKKAGYPAFTEPVETSRGTLWRVRVGGYPTRPVAIEARNRLKADGHNGVVTAAK
jgi:DedD protein